MARRSQAGRSYAAGTANDEPASGMTMRFCSRCRQAHECPAAPQGNAPPVSEPTTENADGRSEHVEHGTASST